jgi:hypothetical protein
MLTTVDQACDFIADWCQEKRSYSGQPLTTGFALPDCIVRLNARVGDLWRNEKRQPRPILQYPQPFLACLTGKTKF